MPYMSNNQQQRILSDLKPRLFPFIQYRATIAANEPLHSTRQVLQTTWQSSHEFGHIMAHTSDGHGPSMGHTIDGQGSIMSHASEGHGPILGHSSDGHGHTMGHPVLVHEHILLHDELRKETGKPMRPGRIHVCPEFLIHEYSRQQNF